MTTKRRQWGRARLMAAITAMALVTVGSVLPSTAASAARAANHQAVRGGWASPTCVFTDYDAVTGAFHCTSSTAWTGTWTGVTHVEGGGTYNFATGSGSGTIEETFVGRASDGTTGTLRFTETWVADGPSLTMHIDARIVEGTGDWVGATGRVSFDGSMSSGTGFGGYVGSWTRPAR